MSKFLTLCCSFLACSIFASMATAACWFDENQANHASSTPAEHTAEIEGFEWRFPAMGTEMSLQTFTDKPEQLEAIFMKARLEADRVTAILTDYDDESETMQLSAAGRVQQWHPVSEELWTVLKEAERWHGLSDGKFDSSIGTLTSMWRRARKSKRWPTEDQITEARSHAGWQHVKLDEAQRKCMITQDGLKLDFGAVAKGYIVDRVFQVLVDAGLNQSMVRAGGDIRVGDPPPGRDGWRVMVGPIAGEADSLKFVTMRNCAIATSGDLWQFIEVNGVRRSHIVDPTTGIGIEGPISASAIAPTSMQADAAATTFCLLGHQRGAALAEELPGFEAMIVSQSADPNHGLRYTTTTGFSYPLN